MYSQFPEILQSELAQIYFLSILVLMRCYDESAEDHSMILQFYETYKLPISFIITYGLNCFQTDGLLMLKRRLLFSGIFAHAKAVYECILHDIT